MSDDTNQVEDMDIDDSMEEDVEETEGKTKRRQGYDDPQVRLHDEDFTCKYALVIFTKAELFNNVLHLGRKSVGRMLFQLDAEEEVPVFGTDLTADEVKEISHYDRPFLGIYPMFAEGAMPEVGECIGLAVGDFVFVGRLVEYDGSRKALTIPVTGDSESYVARAGSPNKPSTGNRAIDNVVVNALNHGFDADVVSKICSTDIESVIEIGHRLGILDENGQRVDAA